MTGEPVSPPHVIRHFHPVLSARALGKQPVRVEVAGQRYALFRDASGKPAALLDRCPHRFAPLSAGRVRGDGRLACPYHGWHFDAQGHGISPSRSTQARCDVAAFQVIERAGYLWLASLDTPAEAMPQTEWDGYAPAGSFTTLFKAPLHVAMDNFSEDEHTPWIHDRLGWDEGGLEHIQYECHTLEDRTEVHYRGLQRWSLAANLLPLRRGDFFHNDWVTRFDPLRTEFNIHFSDAQGRERPLWIKAAIYLVPETAGTTRFHTFSYVRLTERRLLPLLPLFKPAIRNMMRHEIEADARFLPTVAETPFELRGMKLGRFDKPLAHQRKLLRSIYWGEGQAPALEQVPLSRPA